MMRYIPIYGGALLMLASPALAQPANQNNSVQWCATGQVDGFGNPITQPCGYPAVPFSVTQTPTSTAPQVAPTVQCPPNPISKKIPPLC